jgi:hypothetical protein
MLDWFSETMLKIVTSVPALFVAEEFPCFCGRSRDARIWSSSCSSSTSLRCGRFRSPIARYMGKVSNLSVRKR